MCLLTNTWAKSPAVAGDFSMILFSFFDFVTGFSFSSRHSGHS